MSKEHYIGREQTLVKHYILQKYLERFAHIIGSYWGTINYIDCFSGPWNVKSDDFKDSSFCIAANQLQQAQANLAEHGRNLKLRCFFLEKDKSAYAKLKQFADATDYAAIATRNARFEESIDEILAFIKDGTSQSFTFLFIDPTGWTGFEMNRIAPLLKVMPAEALINFMTGHIRRFIDSPDAATQSTFDGLFGRHVPRSRFEGLSTIDLDDALVEEYSTSVETIGRYTYVRPAIVLHPEFNRTHFHLIYATRNAKGVEVFKGAEEAAMPLMESARADARQRKRQGKTGQPDLFSSEVLYDSSHYETLRQRYTSRSQKRVLDLIRAKGSVSYDDAWEAALQEPLVWERDLRDWIEDWTKAGSLSVEGLKGRQRVPRRKKDHRLTWRG